jgi:hypothetical protein
MLDDYNFKANQYRFTVVLNIILLYVLSITINIIQKRSDLVTFPLY